MKLAPYDVDFLAHFVRGYASTNGAMAYRRRPEMAADYKFFKTTGTKSIASIKSELLGLVWLCSSCFSVPFQSWVKRHSTRQVRALFH